MIVAEYRGETITYTEYLNEWSVEIEGFEERFKTLILAKEYIDYVRTRQQDYTLSSIIDMFRDQRKKNLQYWM